MQRARGQSVSVTQPTWTPVHSTRHSSPGSWVHHCPGKALGAGGEGGVQAEACCSWAQSQSVVKGSLFTTALCKEGFEGSSGKSWQLISNVCREHGSGAWRYMCHISAICYPGSFCGKHIDPARRQCLALRQRGEVPAQ